MATVRTNKLFALRLPPDLKRWLQAQAGENHRSLTGEIVVRLEDSRRQQQVRLQQAAA